MEEKVLKKKALIILLLSFILVSCNSVPKTNNSDSSEKKDSQIEHQSVKQENVSKQDDKKDNVAVNSSDINVFWSRFRTLSLNKDFKGMKNFVQFPLETRGPLDSDPIIKYSEDKFEEVMTAYFYGESGMELKETNLDYMKKHEKLDSTVLTVISKNEVRIGNMKFKLVNDSWKLAFLYLDENSYKKLGKDIRKN